MVEDFAGREVGEGWNLGIIYTTAEGEFAFRQRERDLWPVHCRSISTCCKAGGQQRGPALGGLRRQA